MFRHNWLMAALLVGACEISSTDNSAMTKDLGPVPDKVVRLEPSVRMQVDKEFGAGPGKNAKKYCSADEIDVLYESVILFGLFAEIEEAGIKLDKWEQDYLDARWNRNFIAVNKVSKTCYDYFADGSWQ